MGNRPTLVSDLHPCSGHCDYKTESAYGPIQGKSSELHQQGGKIQMELPELEKVASRPQSLLRFFFKYQIDFGLMVN